MDEFTQAATLRSVRKKLIGYLFNPNHRTGWAKGQWFVKALGFEPENQSHISNLEQQITFQPLSIATEDTEWGRRFKQDLTIVGPNGKTIGGVLAIWQVDKDSGIIMLITLMPPKRKR